MADHERGRFRARWVAITVLVVLGLGAAWAVTVSPLFRLTDLAVTGQGSLTRERIIKLAQVSPDVTNVLWVSTGRIRERLEADPWIAQAVVAKDLPSGLSIRIEERAPALTSGQRGAWMLIAGDGVVLDVVKAQPDLPIARVQAVAAGETVAEDSRPLAVAAGHLGAFGASQDVEEIAMDSAGELRLLLSEGGKVTVGPPEELRDKMEAVAGIVKWAEDNGSKIRSIDVTAPGAPAAKVSRGSPIPVP